MNHSPKLGSYYSSVGAIFQTDPTFVNVLSGTTVVNNLVQGSAGFTQTISTSTTITPAQFCSGTSILVSGTTATITITFPSASTTYATCGATTGSWSDQKIVNNSTNTVAEVAGTGMTIRNAIISSTTTTQSATLAATSTWDIWGLYDSSSTVILSQTAYH